MRAGVGRSGHAVVAPGRAVRAAAASSERGRERRSGRDDVFLMSCEEKCAAISPLHPSYGLPLDVFMLHLCVPIAAGTAAGVLPLARKSASIGRLVLRCAHRPAADACRAPLLPPCSANVFCHRVVRTPGSRALHAEAGGDCPGLRSWPPRCLRRSASSLRS